MVFQENLTVQTRSHSASQTSQFQVTQKVSCRLPISPSYWEWHSNSWHMVLTCLKTSHPQFPGPSWSPCFPIYTQHQIAFRLLQYPDVSPSFSMCCSLSLEAAFPGLTRRKIPGHPLKLCSLVTHPGRWSLLTFLSVFSADTLYICIVPLCHLVILSACLNVLKMWDSFRQLPSPSLVHSAQNLGWGGGLMTKHSGSQFNPNTQGAEAGGSP